MQKLKGLLPSLREKKRYLVFKTHSKKPITKEKISKAITSAVLNYVGIKGAAQAGINILNNKYNQQTGIVRVSHKSVNDLKTSLALIKNIDNEPVIFQTIGVSGILKKAEEKFAS